MSRLYGGPATGRRTGATAASTADIGCGRVLVIADA